MTGKKKLSGYENRKLSLLKAKNQLKVINKCRKIEDMFREKTSTVESKYTYTTIYLIYIILTTYKLLGIYHV